MSETILVERRKQGEANQWGLTFQDAKNISLYMLAGKLSADTVYKQLCGGRTLLPIVKDAAESYLEFKVTAKTTHEEIMNNGYARWAKFGFKGDNAIRKEVMNQENPAASAWDGVDLTAEQAAENRESVKRVFR